MMTSQEIAVHTGSALAINEDQEFWNDKQVSALQQLGVGGATNGDLAVFFHQCQRTGLDPFARQIYMIERQGKQTIQTGIDGFRLIARRAVDRSRETLGYEDNMWCGKDGKWVDVWLSAEPPAAAKVTVIRGGERYPSIALYTEYAGLKRDGNPMQMWATKPALMLAKCFDEQTEVLTDRGFLPFAKVTNERIMQVTDSGLEAVEATPFVQEYDGEMVTVQGDMLNFAVTPNHDMVTTYGKVEAGAMLATSNSRGPWAIPMVAPGADVDDETASDDDLKLAGYIVADGWHNGHRLFNVGVSRQYKRDALHALNPKSVSTIHSKGAVSNSARPVQSNFDKEQFSFPIERVARFVDTDKVIRIEGFYGLSQRQVRVFIDAWQEFDGHTNRKSNVRRVYMTRESHVGAFETLAVMAGYSVNVPRERTSDLSDNISYSLTVSEPEPITVVRKGFGKRPEIVTMPNESGRVWCVTVPSGKIVVRRDGFSMVCGNCAEALSLRKAFPQDLSGLYTSDEMQQADNETSNVTPMRRTSTQRPRTLTEAVAQPEPVHVDLESLIKAAQQETDPDRLVAMYQSIAQAPGEEAENARAIIVDLGTKARAAQQQPEPESVPEESAMSVTEVAEALEAEIIEPVASGQ